MQAAIPMHVPYRITTIERPGASRFVNRRNFGDCLVQVFAELKLLQGSRPNNSDNGVVEAIIKRKLLQ